MPNQSDIASHCVVQWEDNKDQYAIVDTKRSKTVSILKVGVTTLFEGYQRERRRGKILFLGTKKDCFAYGFDIVEDDGQLNTYNWSNAPGLREQTEEVAQAIRNGGPSSLRRTTSSSSTSSITSVKTQKRKKLNIKNPNDIDESAAFSDKLMPPPPSTSSVILSEIVNSTRHAASHDQPSSSNNQSTSSISKSVVSNTDPNTITPSNDINSLLEEMKSLREKNLSLQDELLYQREISIPLPNEENYNYLKSMCIMYEQVKSEHNKQAVELGQKLPCSSIELKLAKKPNASATINNVIKCCFKDVELKEMSYEKLKAINCQLLEQIYDYVKHLHAPMVISRTMFSGTISLKCRHLREGERQNQGVSTGAKYKRKPKQKCSSNLHETGNQKASEVSTVLVNDTDEDKENLDD